MEYNTSTVGSKVLSKAKNLICNVQKDSGKLIGTLHTPIKTLRVYTQ